MNPNPYAIDRQCRDDQCDGYLSMDKMRYPYLKCDECQTQWKMVGDGVERVDHSVSPAPGILVLLAFVLGSLGMLLI